MTVRDTIAAIATAPGAGGVAVIRVSGSEAYAIAERIFRRRGGSGVPHPRRVYVGKALDAANDAVLDEVLAFGMRGPHSYTGEDVVEIQCHGGSVISRRILESAYIAGARPAEPGEFTKRAFLNGRLDLAQAEAVADLIAARSEAGRRLAWSHLDGSLSARVESLRSIILRARALCEASLDFSEEDLPDLDDADVRQQLSVVRERLEALAATFDRGALRYQGARVALVGRPNVGKSSLLNAMVGRDRALVTPIPGTTRDVLEASIVIEGSPVVLMDTAGIREAADVVEAMGVDRSRRAVDDAVCVLAIFDGSSPFQVDDHQVRELVTGRRVIAVVNKSDLPIRIAESEVRTLVGDVPIVYTSAVTEDGVAALTTAIAKVVFDFPEDGREDELLLFRPRHRDGVREAIDHVSRAEAALTEGAPLDLVATDLVAAAGALSGITGEMTNEDVLDRVFADFCIGK